MLAAAQPRRRGFSLIEVMMGMLFLSWALLGAMSLLSSTNRGAMDVYYELQAFQVAQEPIEILQAFGYRWVKANYCSSRMNTLGLYPHRVWHDINPNHATNYPTDVDVFQRYIDVEEVARGDSRGLQVTVTVKPKEQSRAMAWLTWGKNISLTALILEQPR